jgi:hypothetical protein
MSEHAASKHPREAAKSYDDPHGAARSSLEGTGGPEDRDPVDSIQTETRSADERESGAADPAEPDDRRGGPAPR